MWVIPCKLGVTSCWSFRLFPTFSLYGFSLKTNCPSLKQTMELVNIDGDISGQVGDSNLFCEADFFSSFTSTCTFIITWQWGLKAGSGLYLLAPEHEVSVPMVSVHICQLTVNHLCAYVVLKVSREVNRCPDTLLLFFIYLLSFLQMSVPFFFFQFTLAMLCGIWDLSSPTRDWTHALCSGSRES